jgi:hypothetical protein
MEEVGILYGHLGYFTAIWAILRPFGTYTYFVAIWYLLHLVICYIFLRFGMLCQDKSGNPGSDRRRENRFFSARPFFWSEPELPDGFFSNQKSKFG